MYCTITVYKSLNTHDRKKITLQYIKSRQCYNDNRMMVTVIVAKYMIKLFF